MQRLFKIMDDDNSKTLNMYELKKAINDFRMDIPDYAVEKIFAAFDANRDGHINYDEFLRTIRGELNEFRLNLVTKAFKVMDKDGSGEIDI